MKSMKQRMIWVLVLALAAVSASAQEEDEGSSMMERGVELFFEGLRQEMSPAMENLRIFAEDFGPSLTSFLEEMGPAFADMLDEVKDWTQYHPPEMLPNGDIIIRRRTEPDATPRSQDDKPGEPEQTDI